MTAEHTPSLPAIVLAAGASQRLGQPKQLVRFQKETLVDRAIRLAQQAGASPRIVVLGAQADAIRATALLDGVTVLVNMDWAEGMASSIRCGMEALVRMEPTAQGVLLLACDQPTLTSAHLQTLIASCCSTGKIAASFYAGRTGIPAAFPASVFPVLQQLMGDAGARTLLRGKTEQVMPVPFSGGEADVDMPEDLAKLGL